MNNYTKENMSIAEKIALENARAINAKNAANIDYIAMMTDVDIPTDEQSQVVEQED